MKFLRVLAILAVLAGATALAAAASRAEAVSFPEPPAQAVQWSEVALEPSAVCPAIYANVLHLTSGLGYATVPGKVIADDLHMVSPGHLCGIDFGYVKTTAGTTTATITFYANNSVDGMPPSVLLAGPYVVSDLPSGTHVIHVELESGVGPPDLTQDVWLGISFSTTSTGFLLANPPDLGSSHDLCYVGTSLLPAMGWIRNFCAAVYANDLTVPAGGSTWGQIKQLYR
jgi:hypothetical protein